MKDISSDDIQKNIPLVTRQDFDREIKIGNVPLGNDNLTIMAGPCTVESRSQIMDIAANAKTRGAQVLRGGVFKPLTFPYGDPLCLPDSDSEPSDASGPRILSKADLFKKAEKRLAYLKEAGDAHGLPVISEIVYADSLDLMSDYVDMFQIGYRHMFNMDLIEALSTSEKPVMIKRHYGESLRSLLGVAEHFEARGKHNFVFCERGIAAPHTHYQASRAIMDVQSIAALKEYAPTVPVFADPSHSTFRASLVGPVSRAAIAAGADGLLIEVHCTPEDAWVDPLNAISFDAFGDLMSELSGIAGVLGKHV